VPTLHRTSLSFKPA